MMEFDNASRRAFLKSAASTGLGMIAASAVGCASGTASPGASDEKQAKQTPAPAKRESYSDLRIAYIGTGGIGGHHLEETTPLGVSCPCYCDVDTTHFKQVAEKFPKAKS